MKKRFLSWLERQLVLHIGVWSIIGGMFLMDYAHEHNLTEFAVLLGVTKGKLYLVEVMFILAGVLMLFVYHRVYGFPKMEKREVGR